MSSRIECVYDDDESASKAARQVKNSSLVVRSLMWRKEITLDGSVTVLSLVARSQDVSALVDLLSSKHPLADPNISFFALGSTNQASTSAVPRFTTPLNNEIINASSAAALKTEVFIILFFVSVVDCEVNRMNRKVFIDLYSAVCRFWLMFYFCFLKQFFPLKIQLFSASFFPHLRIENAFNEDLLEDVYDALAADGHFDTRANDLYLFSQRCFIYFVLFVFLLFFFFFFFFFFGFFFFFCVV
jgi:hypothetical protein